MHYRNYECYRIRTTQWTFQEGIIPVLQSCTATAVDVAEAVITKPDRTAPPPRAREVLGLAAYRYWLLYSTATVGLLLRVRQVGTTRSESGARRGRLLHNTIPRMLGRGIHRRYPWYTGLLVLRSALAAAMSVTPFPETAISNRYGRVRRTERSTRLLTLELTF